MTFVNGTTLLLVDAILFLVISLLCVCEALSGSRIMAKLRRGQHLNNWEGDGEGRTPGAEMRRSIQWALAASSGARGALLLAQVTLPGEPGVAARALPDMLYLTTYTLLAYFWAQLSMALAGKSSRGLRLLLLAGVALLWVAFIVAVSAMAFSPNGGSYALSADIPSGFRRALLYFLAAAHALVFAAIAYFGACIAVPARRRRDVLCRTVAVGAACCAALLARTATCVLLASGILDKWHYTVSPDLRNSLDAGYLFAVELVPSAVILVLTRRRPTHSSASPTLPHAAQFAPLRESNVHVVTRPGGPAGGGHYGAVSGGGGGLMGGGSSGGSVDLA